MYYQLSMVWATVLFSLGCFVWAISYGSKLLVFTSIGVIVVGLMLSIFFEAEAKRTHKELCEVRIEINTRLDAAP